ncbi:ATP-binding SpoIIE family protein phosphatase [Sediminihabitans luteus]|nr:SpoIIE family protein phosphatase [Sediminihabitans luteus]
MPRPGGGVGVPLEARAHAMSASSVAMFLTGSRAEGMPILWVNDAFVRETGFTLEDVAGRGRGPEVLVGRLVESFDVDAMRTAVAQGRGSTEIFHALRADGTPAWIQQTLDPIADPDGDGPPRYWVGVLLDVSSHMRRQAEQSATLEVERRARTGLDVIAQVSDLLADLEYPFVLREIAEHVSGPVVAWAGFYMNDGGLRHAEGIDVAAPPSGRGRQHEWRPSTRPENPPATGEMDALGDPVRPGAVSSVSIDGADVDDAVQMLLDGADDQPVHFDLDGEYQRSSASAWLAADLRERLPAGLGDRDVSVHPVPGRRRVLGLLVVVARASAADDVNVPAVLGVTARRAGLAIDNARLYAREHRLAETLQRAMLPEQADVPGLDVWTYYAPNSEHAQVGGDWYDVLQITQDVVGIVIGDVVGHDVEAAAAMGQLRSVVRSYAYERTTPGPVLERVDALVAGMRIPRSASLVYATLVRSAVPPEEDVDATGQRWILEYSRAGHLPPLLVRDGEVRLLGEAGGPLVGFGSRPRSTGRADLEPGDTLLFYTDGLIERRDRALRVGLDALVETSAVIEATDAAGIGEELLSRLAEAPEDDVALVVVRVPDPTGTGGSPAASPRSRRWLLPSEAASIGRARHAVQRTCAAWELPDVANAELVVSELVANGVLHGWGHIALRLFETGEGLRIEVEDSNPAPPVTTDGHANRAGGFGMQIVERLAEWGWRPSRAGKVVWAKLRPAPERTPVATDATPVG